MKNMNTNNQIGSDKKIDNKIIKIFNLKFEILNFSSIYFVY